MAEPTALQSALLFTGLMFVVACVVVGIWVGSLRTRERASWMRPLVAVLGVLGAMFVLSAVWIDVFR